MNEVHQRWERSHRQLQRTFLGAVGLTVATGFCVGALLTDDPPLPGSNH